MRNVFLVTLIGVMAICSCQKVIEFDGDTKKSKLVINALFGTKDSIKVQVSKSLSVIDQARLKTLTDAQVALYDNSGNKLLDLPHTERGIYANANGVIKPGTEYEIRVSHPDYDDVSAKDAVPQYPTILELDTTSVDGQDEWNKRFRVSVKFKDPSESNYYMLEILAKQRDWSQDPTDPDIKYISQRLYLETRDPNISGFDPTGSTWGQRFLFKDDNFNGSEYTFVATTDHYIIADTTAAKEIVLRLSTVSEAVYNYFDSFRKYQNTRDDPFANPVQVYSNVEKGFGIFGGAAEVDRTIRE